MTDGDGPDDVEDADSRDTTVDTSPADQHSDEGADSVENTAVRGDDPDTGEGEAKPKDSGESTESNTVATSSDDRWDGPAPAMDRLETPPEGVEPIDWESADVNVDRGTVSEGENPQETGPGLERGEYPAEGTAYRGQPYEAAGTSPPGSGPSISDSGAVAPDDQEMPLADHIEEMVRRLGVILILMAGVSAVVFPFGERIINVIWYSFLPGNYALCPTTSVVPNDPGVLLGGVANDVGAGPGVTLAETSGIKPACPRVYQPLATILARFKVATLAGFVVALPAFVYETYLFMRPGLYPRERRYYLAAVPTSLVLAAVGVAFAYLLVLPAIFTYFLYYSQGAADIAFGLTQTFDLMVLMLGFFAAIFQIPLFIMLAIMMGVTSRQWLADRRLLFWAAFAGIAFIFNPDPTGMAPFIIAATMIALFEGTLLLLSWTGSDGLLPSPRAVAARRPYAWLLAGVAGYLASSAPVPRSYYDALPAFVRGVIEANDLLGVTPLVIGGAIVLAYEASVYLLDRYLPDRGLRRALLAGRVSVPALRGPVWLAAIVLGYITSPDPLLLDRVASVSVSNTWAAALAVGLIVGFEVLLRVWRFFRPDPDEQLPLGR